MIIKKRNIYRHVLGVLYRQLHMVRKDKNWVMTTRKLFGKTAGKIDRNIYGDVYLLKVIFSFYFYHYIWLFQWNILFYTNSLMYWVLIRVITSLSFTGLWCFLENVKEIKVFFTFLLPLYKKKVLINFGGCGVALMDLTSHVGKLPQRWKI